MLSVEANSMFADLMKLSIASLCPIVNSTKKNKQTNSQVVKETGTEMREKKVKHDEGEDRERTP